MKAILNHSWLKNGIISDNQEVDYLIQQRGEKKNYNFLLCKCLLVNFISQKNFGQL